MKRSALALSVLGLVCAAALPASAQKKITLFGTTYNVTQQSRAGTFKNGVKINLCTDEINNYAGVYFSEGADRASDRLWFGVRIGAAEDILGDQLYYLEGSDASGNFTPVGSSAKSFFGGNQWAEYGRRPVSVMEINRDNTGGEKKDRNIIACTFYNDDSFRIWDIDSMNGFGHEEALFQRVHPGQGLSALDAGELEADERLPVGTYPSFAHLPTPDGHTILVAAGSTASEGVTGIGIWDTRQDQAYDVLTNITEQTKDAAKPLPATDANGDFLHCNAIARYGDQGEYWMLMVAPEAGGGNDAPRNTHLLYKLKLEIPTDPSKAKPGDIKATVLDSADLVALGADSLFQPEKCGPVHIAVGRPVVDGGPRVLYITDYPGNFYTLTPQ